MNKTQTRNMRLPPLGALPAFAAAAKAGSLTSAAAEMHVTPGAVSRQVKSLEHALGVMLFRRRHNAIELTEAGRHFLVHVNSALSTLETGARAILPDRSRLVIQAPITLARRWLIPRLGSYLQENPAVDISIHSLALGSGETADVTVTYRRGTQIETFARGSLVDRTIAVSSPQLFSSLSAGREPGQVLDLPLLLDTADGWSWHRWCECAGFAFEPRGGTLVFDTDEAAIDACISGLGVGQVNPSFVERELRSGQLLALSPTLAPIVGAYEIAKAQSARLPQGFFEWLSRWDLPTLA
ncbi:LysR family transcriptional regulator [Sinorhizobium medicae]|nr:LysR family transcriptional regulator [Sinorhizobium medicae]